jgi:hypothetical protein
MRRINILILIGVLASLASLVVEQVQAGADVWAIVQIVATTAFALLWRDSDGDGTPDITDSTPNGGE